MYKLPNKKVWESEIDRYYWFPRNFSKLHLREEEFRNGLSCNVCNYEYLEEKAWHLHGRLDGLILLFRFIIWLFTVRGATWTTDYENKWSACDSTFINRHPVLRLICGAVWKCKSAVGICSWKLKNFLKSFAVKISRLVGTAWYYRYYIKSTIHFSFPFCMF